MNEKIQDRKPNSESARQKRPLSLGEWLLLLIIALLALLLYTDNLRLFISWIYSKYAFIILCVMIVEYIILKGRDRSRIFKIQTDHLQKKRHQDFRLRQEVIRELEQIKKELPQNPNQTDTIDEVIEKLRRF